MRLRQHLRVTGPTLDGLAELPLTEDQQDLPGPATEVWLLLQGATGDGPKEKSRGLKPDMWGACAVGGEESQRAVRSRAEETSGRQRSRWGTGQANS